MTLLPRRIVQHLAQKIYGVLHYVPLGIIGPRMMAALGMELGYSY